MPRGQGRRKISKEKKLARTGRLCVVCVFSLRCSQWLWQEHGDVWCQSLTQLCPRSQSCPTHLSLHT